MDDKWTDAAESTLYGFDESWYLQQNPDVAVFRGSPLEHYLHHGWKEGRRPSAGFDGEGYLAVNADVREARVCPLLHFLEYGIIEGRGGWHSEYVESQNLDQRQLPEPNADPETLSE